MGTHPLPFPGSVIATTSVRAASRERNGEARETLSAG